MVKKDWQPDTSLELLSDIYTPEVPTKDDSYDHITKDIVLSQLSKKDILYLLAEQNLIALLKMFGERFAENVKIEKQKIAMFVNGKRGENGFERKQQTTSQIKYDISGPKGTMDKLKGLMGEKKGD